MQVYSVAPAVILRAAPNLALSDGTLDHERAYWVLLYVQDRVSGNTQPTSRRSEAPHWPPRLADYPLEGLDYDLRIVPLSSIALVTSLTQKVCLFEDFFNRAWYSSLFSLTSAALSTRSAKQQ